LFGTTYSYTSKIGYWRWDFGDNGSCDKIPSTGLGGNGLEGAFKFGRFIGIVGSLLIWVVFAAVMTASCFKYPNPKKYFLIISICMGVLSLFSFLLLVGLSEADSLSLAGGGALAILSAFLWAGGAVSMFFCMNERVRVPARNKTTTPKSTEKNATENADDTTENAATPVDTIATGTAKTTDDSKPSEETSTKLEP
jgi:hypothetical protein